MTAEQVRGEAIDRLARFEYEFTHPPHAYLNPSAWTWDARPESSRDLYREWAARRIDALGDMLPTEVESGLIGRSLRRRTRYVGPWQEVTE